MNPRKRGLDRHDVRDVSHEFGIKHRPCCRAVNPKGEHLAYRCVCDFSRRIEAAIMAMAFDGRM